MNHQTEIIEQRTSTDECLQITIRCCGEPSSDSVRTIHTTMRDISGNLVHRTGDEIDADIDSHHDDVAFKHAGMVASRTHLAALPSAKKTKIHSL